MAKPDLLRLSPRRQVLTQNARGWNEWRVVRSRKRVTSSQAAILICDMWDNHSFRGAAERVNDMAPRMNEVVKAARARGVHIIHSPSDTMDFYAEHPARKRMLAIPAVTPPTPAEHPDPPLPFDARERGSDTNETKGGRAWTRQNPAIEIRDEDVISDQGAEVYRFLRHDGLTTLFIMGVHTNFCVLGRTFGIKAMVRWGVDVLLVRDLTDAIYNPAMPPYVSHDQGTKLVVEFIEKFWCPSIHSRELVAQ